jgi:NADPH:quinone reductase-like Zn-dependent oxidoreductase
MFSYGAGAFAEYVCARERAFALIPEDMSFEDAATLPHSATLALQGLRLRKGRTIRPGDRVLIVGASGNVGPFAVQIAKARGAEVTGVCRTEKVEFVRSLGADHVVDYTKVDWTRAPERYDWILDVDAHQSIPRSRRALRPNGAYVAEGGSGWWLLQALFLGTLLSRFTDKWSGLMIWWRPFQAAQDDFATLKELITAGKLRPVIDRRYPLDEAVAALTYVNDGLARGKVVITV